MNHNPFDVLELTPAASHTEVERRAQQVLGKLELGFSKAKTFRASDEEHERDEALVRWALDQLRKPDARLSHELSFTDSTTAASDPPSRESLRWHGALRRFGFSRCISSA
ncbi:MAG: hypothetical protein AAF658_15375 [Myxococcota bacterium]